MNVRVLGLVEGLMVYWDEVKDAAQYHVHLYIAHEQTFQEIAMVDVERNIKYYSFEGLATINIERTHNWDGISIRDTGLNYCVEVEAEDRGGTIIDKSAKCYGNVLRLNNAGER